jgi:hypothetical protein
MRLCENTQNGVEYKHTRLWPSWLASSSVKQRSLGLIFDCSNSTSDLGLPSLPGKPRMGFRLD